MEIECHILAGVIIMAKDWPHVKPKNKSDSSRQYTTKVADEQGWLQQTVT